MQNASAAVDWAAIRAEFPALENWTFLNTATYGQVPVRSRKASDNHYARRDEFACSDFLGWFDDADGIRASIAELIHASADDIAFATNSATALGLFIGGIAWEPGDRIATLADEFPNQQYFPKALSARGVEIVEITGGPLPARTRAVLASTVNYATGFRVNCAELRRLADNAGALLYLDGTQSLGALCMDVRETRPDFLAVNGYKWLLSPNGGAFFYVAPELRKTLEPAVVGWRSDRDWRAVNALHNGAPRFVDAAERYEGGMIDFPSVYAMGESVRMILDIGPRQIESRVLELGRAVEEILRSKGASILNPGTNIIAGRWEGFDAALLTPKLGDKRILVSSRYGNLRVSPHFYNNESDLSTFRAALAEALP